MAYNPKDKNPSGVVLFGNNGSDQVFESITDFVYDTGNTRLGISTSSPQYTLDVSGTGAFHTIRFADGTEMTTSGGGGGGGTNWNLSVEGDSTNIGDGETVDFTGQGNITLSRSSNTVIISGAAGGGGGGGGTPGGSNTQVQFNDGGSFGGSPAFTFNGSTVTITGTGLLFDVRNVSADTLFSIEDTNESSIIAAAQAGQTGYILDIRDRFDTNIAHIDPSGKLHYQSSFSPISNEGTASSFTFNLDKSNVFSGTLNLSLIHI